MDPTKLEDIHQALPHSTQAERQRFLADRSGDTQAAIISLRNYLAWRKQHCNDDASHADSWTRATQLAVQTSGKRDSEKTVRIDVDPSLPCTIFLQEHEPSITNATASGSVSMTMQSKKYLQLLPARIDTTLADTSIYALALAIYIDRVLDRHSTETTTLVIDVRSGHGWANIKALQLLPFIKSTVRLLCELYPGRLERCVVFPLPAAAQLLWKAARPFLGTETRERVCLVSGPAGRNDGTPQKLRDFLDEGLIAKLEERRTSCFVR